MGSKVSYTLVGLFVVLLTIGLIAAGLWFGGDLEGTGETRYYSVYTTDSVTGLSPGALVTYKGVAVGSVARIAIDRRNPQRIHLVLAVEPATPVSANTVATLQLRGLTGVTSVELSGYDPKAPPPPTPPGERYPVIQSQKSLLTHINQAISEGIGTLNQITKQLSELLSEQNRQALTDILANFARLSGTLAANSKHINQTLANLDQISQNSVQITARLPQTVERLDRSLQGLYRLSQSLNQSAASLTEFGRSGKAGINQLLRTTVPDLEALFADLRRATNQIDSLVQEIQREPTALLRGPAPRPPGPGEE
ncbi:MAG TPA: MlaD family protein [Nitrococcus sp.]|nr:MlaD family protein [Nitrococcus sp.]